MNSPWRARRNRLRLHIAATVLHSRPEDISFSPDGKRIAIADSDLRVWDIEPVADFDALMTGGMDAIVFSPDQRHVATLPDEKTVRIWRMFPDPDLLIAAAKKAMPRCSTADQRRERS